MIINIMKKEILFFNNDVIENENKRIILFFQLIFRNKIEIEIKYILNIVENLNAFDVINIIF